MDGLFIVVVMTIWFLGILRYIRKDLGFRVQTNPSCGVCNKNDRINHDNENVVVDLRLMIMV
jgi:hypothetical protein